MTNLTTSLPNPSTSAGTWMPSPNASAEIQPSPNPETENQIYKPLLCPETEILSIQVIPLSGYDAKIQQPLRLDRLILILAQEHGCHLRAQHLELIEPKAQSGNGNPTT